MRRFCYVAFFDVNLIEGAVNLKLSLRICVKLSMCRAFYGTDKKLLSNVLN